MADASVVHVGENSPEEVALKLLRLVAKSENKTLDGMTGSNVDKKWLLTTYAQCILTVRNPARVEDHIAHLA